MNTKYFGEKAKKVKSSERAEAMPTAIITAIISSMILLGIATVVSMVVQEKGDAQNNVALTTIVSNIDVSLRSDVTQASYITAAAKLKQPAARTLVTTDVLLSGVNMHIPATNNECKVVRWSINGTTASRDLTIYTSSVKTDSFIKCDETSPVLAKRTKVFAKDVNVQAPFKFNNQVGRPIAFSIDSVSLAKVNTELEKQLTDKGVQKLNDTDFNELNKLMSTDSYSPGFIDACVMNATKVNGICPPAEADTVAAAWGSMKIAKVSVSFEISTNGGETAKRDIEQNSSVPLYSNAAEAEAAVANSSADNRPVSPVPAVAATVTLGTNYTINWTAGGVCPVDMTLSYKLYENNALIASQPTRNFTKNYTNSATQFLNYVVQTDCIRGALVISSDMSAPAITKVIPAAPSSLVINAQPPATNAALNSNLTSTATCLYGTSPRYNLVQSVASYGAAGTTVANQTTVNRAINSGFTVVEGASYQYRVEAWCISAFDKSSLTNVNTNTFSTLINAPASAPAFTAPLQGASNVAINAPVTWNAVVCATGTTTQYSAEKDTNAGVAVTPTVINAWTTALSFVSNNTQGNTVGYTVQARCHGTAPSGVDSVPTIPGTVSYTTVINTPAAVPAFISPADNATGVATNATVTWGAIVCPTATTTQYFTTKNLNGGVGISPATVIDNWTTDVSLISANTQGSLVGYTVAARCAGPNANSGATAADTLNYTTLIAAPAMPLFTAPAEGATNIATNAAVTWAAATCATGTIPKYFTTKNINLNVTLATPTVIDNWSANRTLTTANTEGTTVGYTVAARCEGPSAVSVGSSADTVKFTTAVTAPASTLINSPAGNATNVATNATVAWNSVTCALGVTPKYYVVKNVDAGLSITHIPMVSYTTALSVVTGNTQGNTVGYAVKARCDGPQANSADSAFTWMRYTTAISAPTVPAITAPINGSTDVALSATVTWNAATCAVGTTAKYFAVKDMDKNVAIPAVTVVDYTTALSVAATNTEGNRVGYAVKARCDGPNANSVDGGWGYSKFTTMVKAPTGVPVFTAPLANAMDVATNATVTWSGVTCTTGMTPKYYMTKDINAGVAVTPAVLDNWTVNLSYVSNNTQGNTVGYTVAARCDGPNDVSVPTATSTLKYTTLVNAPAAPVFTAPAEGATNIATNATVTWSVATCATGTTVQYFTTKNTDRGVGITAQIIDNWTVGNTLASNNTQGNTVGYTVAGRCVGPNDTSGASATSTLKYTTLIATPAQPTFTAPANAATDVPTNVTLTWTTVTCAPGTTTEYYLSKKVNAGVAMSAAIYAWTTNLNYVTNDTQGNAVGYNIAAHCDGPNADSSATPDATVRYTTAISAPATPLFTSPAEGATNIATNAAVTWGAVVCPASTTAKYYTTKNIDKNVVMATPTVLDNWNTDVSYVSANTEGTTVGYTVMARCDGPNATSTSTVSDTVKYTTLINSPTTVPVFTAPLEGAMDVTTTVSVTWSAAICAPSTTVQYYTTKNMNAGAAITAQVIDNWSSSTGTSLASSNTQGNKVGYTVAARCVGPNVTSGASATDALTYTTAISAPAMPLFTSPAEGATNVATNATVTWSVVTCAPSTTVKYYTTKNMTAGVAAGPWVIDNWTAGNSLSNANPEGNRVGYTVAARCDGPNDVSASSATDSLTYTTAITAPATPLFTSPAEGATGIATNATVTWAAAVCGAGTTAKYYTTKNIDKNVAITPVIIDNYTTGTTLATSNTEGTTVGYTVRARCDGANVISAASTSDTLKYTTMIAAPAAPTSILPANGSTDVATDATVTWSAVTCATGATPAYFAVKNMEAGVVIPDATLINYTSALSVGTNNAQGNRVGYAVHARCEGPNADSVRSGWFMTKYTTMVATPAMPLFTSPAEAATNVATNATVTWSAVTCATGTTVKYYTTKDFDRGVAMTTPTVIDNWTTGNTLVTSNTQGNRVGYTVKARCDGPNDVSASSTTEYVKYITVINAPAKPYYTSPAEAATNVATNATLTWGAVTCPTGTTTEYYTTKNMNAGAAIAPSVMDAWNTDLTYVTNNTQGNRVGYTVKAHCDGPNADSADSATDTLTYTTMIATPAEPVFTSPAGTSMDIATNATVTWAASVCGSGTTTQYYTTKYNDKDVNLTTPIVIDNWTTGTTLATSNTQGTTVGYTVAARCVGPNVTSGSSTNDYLKYTTIMNAPAKPMFTTPAEGATGISTTSAVTWNAVTCATGGTVQYYTKKNVDKGVTMTTPTVIDNWSSTTGTSLATSNTQGNTVGYTVEARCVGPNDTSVSSGIDSLKYTTVINAPAKPYYTAPAEGATGISSSATLTWTAVTCPTGTTTEYYTTKNMNAGVIDTTPSVLDSWSTDLTYVTSNTQGNRVGYTVKAHCDGPNADSADSATDTLTYTTTISNPSVAPVFTSPAEGETNVATSVTVTWSAAVCQTGTKVEYYTTKNVHYGATMTTPTVIDNWSSSTGTGLWGNNTQGNTVGYTVKARCAGPNANSGSSATDTLTYTTKVTAPAAVSSWTDGALTVGWGSQTCAAEADIYYRVVDRKINNNTVANYGAWQPEGQWGNTSWVSAWPSVKNGYPQWADVQAKCVGVNDESSVTYGANTTKWIRSFSVSFSAAIMPQPGGKWRRMTVDAACPADTTLDGVWLYVAGNGWGATRTPGNQIQTDEGHWIDGALGAGTGGNSGWVELSRTQNTQWIDTTANWGASGTQGWGARVIGNDMHGTYWNATSWGNYAYWWYGACETPYATVGNIGSHWENNDGTNTIRNVGDPGTRHNAALNGMALKAAGTTALQ